jgi:hypothetical protein
MTHRHVEEELLAYLDGMLPPQEETRVTAHLVECPTCAAELERLRALQLELGATFDTALSPVRLPSAADHRIRAQLRARAEPRGWRALWQRRGVIAQAMLGALAVLLVFATVQLLIVPPQAAAQETLVLGQDEFAPGTRAALRVVVRDAEAAQPVAGAEVVVRLGRTPGLASVVYTGRTDAQGTAEVAFTVPEELEGAANLVVETASSGVEARIVRPITVARDVKLFLTSDKPAYRPGQTIHLRTLALDANSLGLVAGDEVTFALVDPAGREIDAAVVASSDFGIAWADFTLPEGAALGQYALRAALSDTVSERTVVVDEYELPAFRVTLETDRSFYGSEDQVTGFAQAEYFYGQPVGDATVILRGYANLPQRTTIVQLEGSTDAEGRYTFAFDLPAMALDGFLPFDLEVEVVDAAGRQEGVRAVLPVAAQPIFIDAVPESGVLKPGVENAIFILTAYPDGQPAETELTVRSGGEEYVLETGPYGLAEWHIVPAVGGLQFSVEARDAEGTVADATFAFEGDSAPQTLLLRVERAAYEVGGTLRAEVLTAGVEEGASIYMDVVRERQAVAALSSVVEDGRAVFALDLDGTMVGTLELHAYTFAPGGDVVEDTRRVLVDTPSQVAVAVAADREQYHPGDTARLEIATAHAGTGQAVQSAVGIGVVDASVLALETQPAGFARSYFLLEEELREAQRSVGGFDVVELLDIEEEIRTAQDAAAWASWAGVPGTGFSLAATAMAKARVVLPGWVVGLTSLIAVFVTVLPLFVGSVVVRGLYSTFVLKKALRRTGLGFVVAFVGAPFVGGAIWLTQRVLGVAAPLGVSVVILILLVGLAIQGWWRRDRRIQLVTGLLVAYLASIGLLVALAARGVDLYGVLLALVIGAFLVLAVALVLLGQGLVLEGWRYSGWAATVLALLLVILAIYLPFVPGLSSNLTRGLGSPALYAGPLGWVTGCGPMLEDAPQEPTEEPIEEPTEEPVEGEEVVVTATPAPTMMPAPTATPQPAEPLPLRQIFPETLYWNPEARTDQDGYLSLDLPLADSVTTWQLTALASTEEGALGVATFDLRVVQDLFIEFELPEIARAGETSTVTVVVYNMLPEAQTVQVELAPGEWYGLVDSAPVQSVDVPAGGVAGVAFSIRPLAAGEFALQAQAEGEYTADAIAAAVTVTP